MWEAHIQGPIVRLSVVTKVCEEVDFEDDVPPELTSPPSDVSLECNDNVPVMS